ncbi:hypothetical protein CH64_3682 [Yersinia rohdei]|uniref:Lipoprotein n=1 Tax=Yersinia rohdei TaxID=29485 RepID=A0ABN4F3T3_YERRO|nr:hypothetical protein [Yersinia rohdei]AJJ11363.1 hypothetical protein CH64_3682 [Yersinia rohdei]MDN0094559.1 hypothetical protein [Yersinia rohdei]
MLRLMLLLCYTLNLLGCTSVADQKQSYDSYTITPGIGIENLSLGDSIEHAKSKFSKDFVMKDGYLLLPTKGIDASYNNEGKIAAIFLYYRLPKYKSFEGITDKGIGKNSSIQDVYKAYGTPTREGDSVVSEFGAMPGAHEHTITYRHSGIEFTFWDKQLTDIRVINSR